MRNLVLTTSLEDHSTDLLQKITNLFKENVLTDVTLVCEDHTRLEAHKVILGAASSIFREMLCHPTHSHPLVFLKGVRRNELQSLLDFIYNGETSIQQDCLEEFMKIGKTFEVAGLTNTNDENVEKEKEVAKDENETLIFPCDFCDFKTKDIEDLNHHKVLNHPITKYVDYFEVDTKDVSRGKDMNKDPALSCVLCSYVANNKKDLNFHNQNVHLNMWQEEEKGRFVCEICLNSYSKEGNLRLHKKVKHASGSQRLQCDFCEQSYTRVDTLREHVMSKHEKTAKFFCKSCDFRTMRPAKLKKHIIDFHN